MKAYQALVRWGLFACLLLGPGAASLLAREYYDDKEVFGTLEKVDTRKKFIKVDRGPDRHVKVIKWTSKTQFRDGEKRVEPAFLKVGQKVRVYYCEDKKRTGQDGPVANKIVLNPASSPTERRYNE